MREDVTMYQSPRSYQKSFSARHAEALRIVGTYRFMSPAAFASQDHLAMSLAHHATVGDDTGRGAPRKGIVRCWLGAGLVRLETRLGGAGGPNRTTLAPGKVAA
jgi:hypothetical protein